MNLPLNLRSPKLHLNKSVVFTVMVTVFAVAVTVIAVPSESGNRGWRNGPASASFNPALITPAPPIAPAPPQGSSYAYRRTITIDHTKVPNTDQSNFPLLISGTYSYLATVSNGGNVQNANGYDVIFTSDAGCATKLDGGCDLGT